MDHMDNMNNPDNDGLRNCFHVIEIKDFIFDFYIIHIHSKCKLQYILQLGFLVVMYVGLFLFFFVFKNKVKSFMILNNSLNLKGFSVILCVLFRF